MSEESQGVERDSVWETEIRAEVESRVCEGNRGLVDTKKLWLSCGAAERDKETQGAVCVHAYVCSSMSVCVCQGCI